jgi:hypothetical protein
MVVGSHRGKAARRVKDGPVLLEQLVLQWALLVDSGRSQALLTR